MNNGKKAQIGAGIPVKQGKAPYGYGYEGHKRETRLVIFADEARIVVLIFACIRKQTCRRCRSPAA
jgi:hypothetical protein